MNPQEIMDVLQEISNDAQVLGNKLRQLSAKTTDVVFVEIINSLANDAYKLAIDITDSADDYADILEERIEEETEEEF